jgi:uncharacterized membrane protein YheB (UPF0754 family)
MIVKVMFFFNVIAMVAFFFLLSSRVHYNGQLKKIVMRLTDESWDRIHDYELQQIVMDNLGEVAKRRLDDLVDKAQREVINNKADKRVEEIVDEWCAEYTTENYDMLLREKLRLGVKERLEGGLNPEGDQYSMRRLHEYN